MREKMKSYLSILYDKLENALHRSVSNKYFSLLFLFVFCGILVVIQLNQMFRFPPVLQSMIPASKMSAVEIVLSLILLKELLDMIFAISYSVTDAQLKQLEVLSLILLRLSFKEIPEFEQITLMHLGFDHPIAHLFSYGLSSFVIFIIILLFYRIPRTPREDEENNNYIFFKKIIVLLLFISYISIGMYDVVTFFQTHMYHASFDTFFRVFLFADIAIVIYSFGQNRLYATIYRNTGFALATVLILVALGSPQYFQELISVITALYAYALAYAYNRYCIACKIKTAP